MLTEKLKRKSLLFTAASVDSATAGALLAVDRLHHDAARKWVRRNWPSHEVLATMTRLERLAVLDLWSPMHGTAEEAVVRRARTYLDMGVLTPEEFRSEVDAARGHAGPTSIYVQGRTHDAVLPRREAAILGGGGWKHIVLGAPFDASRDTLLREPFASQLRPDLLRVVEIRLVHDEPCLRIRPDLSPRRWKRGQKRTARDRRRTRGTPMARFASIRVEDVPRVGERARERAVRAKFGGDW